MKHVNHTTGEKRKNIQNIISILMTAIVLTNLIFTGLIAPVNAAAIDPLDTWDTITIEGGTFDFNSIAYGEVNGSGMFVTVGNNGKIYTSSNGSKWDPRTSPCSSDNIVSIAYGNGSFVAVTSTRYAIYSTDGIKWDKTYIGQNTPKSITYGNGYFLVSAGGTGYYYTSTTDGVSWLPQRISGLSTAVGIAQFGGNKFIMSSVLSKTWYSVGSPTSWNYNVAISSNNTSLSDACYGNDKFVFVGGSALIATSPDGVGSWQLQQSQFLSTERIYTVCFGNNVFVISGICGRVCTSPDGEVWTQRYILGTASGKAIIDSAFGGGKFVLVGTSGLIMTCNLGSAAVTTKGTNYTVTTSGLSGTIVTNTTPINTATTVSTFIGNLIIPSGASYKVVPSTTTISNATDFNSPNATATAKSPGAYIANNDKLAVLSSDGATLNVYTVTLASADATVTTKSTSYNVTTNGLSGTIKTNTIPILSSTTVSEFVSNLNIPAGASYKVVPSTTAITNETDFNGTTAVATAKLPGATLSNNDKLAVLAQDGLSLNVYTIAIASNNASVTTQSNYYTVVTGGISGTISANTLSITISTQVSAFTGNLNIPTGAGFKIVSSATTMSSIADYNSAAGKLTTDTLVNNDKLAVLSEDQQVLNVYTITVSSGAAVSPVSAIFDKAVNSANNSNITVNMSLNGYSLNGIYKGPTALTLNSDYTISGNIITLNKSYLSTLPDGSNTLAFKFNAGPDQTLAITVSDTSPIITPGSAAFDKATGAANNTEVVILGTFNGNTLSSIKNGATALVPNTDYSVSGSTITIKKVYLSTLAVGNSVLTFKFSAGADQTLTITVTDSSPAISPTVAVFDKSVVSSDNNNINVTMILNGKSLSGIYNGADALVSGTHYTRNGSTVTINKSYLERLPVGAAELVFKFNIGLDQKLTISISDSSNPSLSPSSVVFDKSTGSSDNEDITIAVNLHGKTLTGIKDNVGAGYTLQQGTSADYTESISGDVKTVTIHKSYLNTLPANTAPKLTFSFSGGAAAQYLTITVVDTTPSITPSAISFDKAINSGSNTNKTVAMTLNGNMLGGIYKGAAALVEGTAFDYTVSGNNVDINKNYLNSLSVGQNTLNFQFTSGISLPLTVNVTDSSPSITASGGTSFDKATNAPNNKDITVTMTLNGNTLSGLSKGGTALEANTDYTVSGSSVTIKKSYLATLANGTNTLTFKFSAGADQPLTITVSDNSPTLSPASASFDKTSGTPNNADISVSMTLYNSALTGIYNGLTALAAGAGNDYTVSGSSITISKNYLKNLPAGANDLTFKFNIGLAQKLTVNVSASVSHAQSADAKVVSPNGSLTPIVGTDNIITLTVYKSDGSVDITYNGMHEVTVTGYSGNSGTFNGHALTGTSIVVSDVDFISGVAVPKLVLYKTAPVTIGFSMKNGNAKSVAAPDTNTLVIAPAAGPAATMELLQDIEAPTVSGGLFFKQPIIALKDSFGNVCSNDNSTVVTAAAIVENFGDWTLSQIGTPLGNAITARASNGVVTFAGLKALNNKQSSVRAKLAFNTGSLVQITSGLVILTVSADLSGAIAALKVDGIKIIGNDFDIKITEAVNYQGAALRDNVNVKVKDNIDGIVYDGDALFQLGSATVTIPGLRQPGNVPLTISNNHALEVSIAGVTPKPVIQNVIVGDALKVTSKTHLIDNQDVPIFGVDQDYQIVYGIEVGTTKGKMLSGLIASNNASVEIYGVDASGNKLAQPKAADSTIVTGDIIVATGNNQRKEYMAIIFGDANGDGLINIVDVTAIKRHITEANRLIGAKLIAANAKRSGTLINALDILAIKKSLLTSTKINQD